MGRVCHGPSLLWAELSSYLRQLLVYADSLHSLRLKQHLQIRTSVFGRSIILKIFDRIQRLHTSSCHIVDSQVIAHDRFISDIVLTNELTNDIVENNSVEFCRKHKLHLDLSKM